MNDEKTYEKLIKVMKVLRWPLEFVAVLFVGWLFVKIYKDINPTSEIDLRPYILYLTTAIWVSALRIVCTIKKNKDGVKDPPQ